ncbi:MAG: hydrogenase maturation protease [Anaerolineae bacterium]|nr:hydrogenase maturation protease [Anaerolineae bacterium]
MVRTLIIGYGNPDREDDGVAWHILHRLAERWGRAVSPITESGGLNQLDESPALLAILQLTPELAEEIARYDYVCFVDAHTGAYNEDIRFQPIASNFQTSPFTHHLTPESCLFLAATLYGHAPRARVLSVRGYRFGFSRTLSPETAALVEEAVESILGWLEGKK